MVLLGAVSPRCLWKCPARTTLCRLLSSSLPSQAKAPNEPRDKWNYNTTSFIENPGAEHVEYQLVDANLLETATTPPRKVKMLARDFIEDSLYNPNYGYFPKHATIFDTQGSVVDFSNLRDSVEFQEEVAQKYAAYGADRHDGPGRQLWHTPTELFKVHPLIHLLLSHAVIVCSLRLYSLGTDEQSPGVLLPNTC